MMTLEGLRIMRELQRNGQPLPPFWLEEARHYLGLKRRAVRKFGRVWDREQLQEAESLLKTMLTDMGGYANG